jgi:hypothetical protein
VSLLVFPCEIGNKHGRVSEMKEMNGVILFYVSVNFTYIIPHFLHFTTALKFEEEELKLGKDGKRREKTWGWFWGTPL